MRTIMMTMMTMMRRMMMMVRRMMVMVTVTIVKKQKTMTIVRIVMCFIADVDHDHQQHQLSSFWSSYLPGRLKLVSSR